jgi:hypothetical protein
MSRVILDLSKSLDGFIAAANQRPEEPLGGAANDSTIGRAPATTTATAVLTGGVEGTEAVTGGRR